MKSGSRCRLSRGTIDLGKPWGVWNLRWGGMGRGSSVYEQPGTKVDRIAPHKGGITSSKRELARGIGKGD